MPKQAKKHQILGGIKVSSRQLAEWGSCGGRPRKYLNSTERARAFRLRKKQEKFGEKAQLEERKTYGEIKIDKYLTCPHCHNISRDLGQYFDKQGKFIAESFWFDTIKMEKTRIKENKFWCEKCHYSYSFLDGEIVVNEVKTVILRAGSGKERGMRFKGKKKNYQ